MMGDKMIEKKYMKTLGADYDFLTEDQLKQRLRRVHEILKSKNLDDSEIKIWKSLTKNCYVIKFPNIETSVELRKLIGDDPLRIEFALQKQKAMGLDYAPDIIFIQKNKEYKERKDLEDWYKKLK